MFETLDTIKWSQVESCYSRSNEIPAAIRGLVSDDAAVRQEAFGTLWSNLEHQGSVYEASALAVPFLLEILARPQSRDKLPLVHLLACLGSKGAHLGADFQPLETRLLLHSLNEEPPIPREAMDNFRTWTEETHQAVREGLSLFLPLLADPDPAMRMEIAFLLSNFKEDHAWLSPLVMIQLREETDESVQCCLLLCLGRLLPRAAEDSYLLMYYLVEGETALLQFTAAMALCTLLKDETPEEVVHLLFQVLVDPFSLQPSYERLPPEWGSCWVHMRALYYLDRLVSSPYRTLILERLIEVLPILDHRIDQDCADLLLRVAFFERGFRLQSPMTFDDLDPIQQKILHRIAATETLWRSPWEKVLQGMMTSSPEMDAMLLRMAPGYTKALAYVGLPSSRQGLQAFIATTAR